MIRRDFQSFLIDIDREKKQRQVECDLNKYRRLYQRPEYSREWDLNNPKILKLSKPIRTEENENLLGCSSAQIFKGEDRQASSRKRIQQQQMKTYFQLQVNRLSQRRKKRK